MPLTNAYGDIDGTIAAKLEKNALAHVKPFRVLELGAKKFTQPKNATQTVRMRRAIPYAAATTPLSEGVPPTATQIRYDELDITMAQYGGYTPVTDIMVDFHTTPILKDINELNAEQCQATREALLWGILKAATNVQYAGGVASLGTTVALLDKDEQDLATRTLRRNKAKKFTKIVTGGVKINTTPIEAAYVCFIHSDAEKAVRNMAGFTPCAQYGSMSPISENELGAVDDVRYISSPDLDPQIDSGAAHGGVNISTSGTLSDVYTALYSGMDAYGCVNMAGQGSFTPVVRNIGKPTDTDPLGQLGHVGWKMYTANSMLNQDWVVAVKHCVAE